MSFENQQCPCGDKKQPETMLCAACEKSVAGTFDRSRMDDRTAPLEARRRSAIRILSECRRRKPSLPLSFTVK